MGALHIHKQNGRRGHHLVLVGLLGLVLQDLEEHMDMDHERERERERQRERKREKRRERERENLFQPAEFRDPRQPFQQQVDSA